MPAAESRKGRRPGKTAPCRDPENFTAPLPPRARASARSTGAECDRPRRGRVPASNRLPGTRVLGPRRSNPRLACSGRGHRRTSPHLHMRGGSGSARRRPGGPRSPARPVETSVAARSWPCTMRGSVRSPGPPRASTASSGILDGDSRFDRGRARFLPLITPELRGQVASARARDPDGATLRPRGRGEPTNAGATQLAGEGGAGERGCR